jgi:protein-tyrosine phosphatase
MGKQASVVSSPMLRRVLFLCSGNYYRSRFCEEFFNHHVTSRRLSWHGLSRALRSSPAALNPGPMSPFAVEYLRRREVQPVNHLRLPLEVTDFDLHTSDLVIAAHEPEHRPMIELRWPTYAASVEYWQVPDLDVLAPDAALRRLDENVTLLVQRLLHRHAWAGAAQQVRFAT